MQDTSNELVATFIQELQEIAGHAEKGEYCLESLLNAINKQYTKWVDIYTDHTVFEKPYTDYVRKEIKEVSEPLSISSHEDVL